MNLGGTVNLLNFGRGEGWQHWFHTASATPVTAAQVWKAWSATVRPEAFDWNCPQHIPQRFTTAEIEGAVASLRARLEAAERENAELRDAISKQSAP